MPDVLKDKIESLCGICFKTIPAKVFIEAGKVYIEKRCPLHGTAKNLVENDEAFYKKFTDLGKNTEPYFYSLIIPVTYKCNMACSFCYASYLNSPEPSLDFLKEKIKSFPGELICLSGGEPTLRKDLPEILLFIKQCAKFSILLTNGLRLADKTYTKSLKKAGVDSVLLSFDSLQGEFYRLLRGENCLLQKKQALENLRDSGILTSLSVTIYPGINDNQIHEIFKFAFANRYFIKEIRIRTPGSVCRYETTYRYFGSDLLKSFLKETGINRNNPWDSFLSPNPILYRKMEKDTIHHIQFLIRGLDTKDGFIPIPVKSVLKSSLAYLKLSFQKKGVGGTLKELKNFIAIKKNIFQKANWIYLRFALPKKGLKTLLGELSNFFYCRLISLAGLPIRIISWPTKENIDLQEVDRGIAQLTRDGKILNFCHAIIMEEGMEKLKDEPKDPPFFS